MKAVVAAITAAFVMPLAADAQEAVAEKAAVCSALTDSLARLTCFDRLFPRDAAPERPNDASPPPSAWDIRRERSPIDDSPKIIAALAPKSMTYSGMGEGSAWLVLRCQENVSSAYFSTSMFMTSDTIAVTTRLDEGQAKTEQWNRSSSYDAVGRWQGSTAIPFMKSLAESKALVVRIEDRERLDAQYDLGNAAEVVAEISSACGWKM